jgi:hypothetical protein
MAGMTAMIVLVALRFWIKIRNLREVREDMKYLKSQLPTARNSPPEGSD